MGCGGGELDVVNARLGELGKELIVTGLLVTERHTTGTTQWM